MIRKASTKSIKASALSAFRYYGGNRRVVLAASDPALVLLWGHGGWVDSVEKSDTIIEVI